MERISPPPPLPTREHVHSLLEKLVLDIQSTDRQLTDLVISQNIYDLCRRFAEEELFRYRYENHKVFEILQEDSKVLNASEAEVNKMKTGLKSLLRYPLNLLVAPNRPELKIIKASTSFFMFQVKRNLKDAHSFLSLMGYNQVRNATDLSLSKSFSIDRVYTLVLDIVILHEELEIISFLISQPMPNDVKLYHYFIARRYGPSDKWDCLDYIRKGEATRKALSLEQYPHPSSLTTTGWDQYREHSTGQSYHNNDYRGYRDERYDNTDYRYRHDDDRGASQGYYYHEDEQRRYHYPYGNESGHHQYRDDQYQYRDQYYQNQRDRDHRSQYQYQDDRYQHQYDPHFRDQRYDHSDQRRHVYSKDERYMYQRHEDQEQSKRREVECDGGQFVNDVSTSQRSNDTATYMRLEDSISGMPLPMFNASEMRNMFKVPSSTPRKEVVASDDPQPHSLNHFVSKSDSFDEQLGITYERRTSSTPSFRPDSSYTNDMYRPFPVYNPSEPVSFTINEETESERNEDEISSRSNKPRRNNPHLGVAGSTNSSSTWSGTPAEREVILRPMSRDDSVLVMADSYWTCTFCSNENYGRSTICEACNQERPSLHSY